ncbi:MAG: phosphoribosylaminoimidazolesuccinocarboxamide synthase [Chloroflexi bacterium]|nr:phosphoribosylaminoimidazolesuccinocarboxamide synthase [Chloroflexota bacterium]
MLQDKELRSALPLALQDVELALPGHSRGKVREAYALPGGRRLLVTTDRLSAFDVVLGAVPYKGQVLNQLSAFWFREAAHIIPHHLVDLPDPNAAVVQTCQVFPVEVVVRGYITGVTSTALWYRYEQGERVIYGHRLPEGLRKNEPLPAPLITPTTKGGPTGHDERLTPQEVVDDGWLDAETWAQVQEAAVALFRFGQERARQAGLLLVDTKYEFGRAPDGTVRIVDEVHTPDSSRFWVADTYQQRMREGQEPDNYDKEYVRLWYASQGYRGDGTPPPLSPELAVALAGRYIHTYERLTGEMFQPGAYPAGPRIVASLRRAGLLAE